MSRSSARRTGTRPDLLATPLCALRVWRCRNFHQRHHVIGILSHSSRRCSMRLQRFRGQRDDFGLLLDVHDGRWGAYQATNRQVPQCQSESLNPVPPTNSSWRRCSARPGVCQAQCHEERKNPTRRAARCCRGPRIAIHLLGLSKREIVANMKKIARSKLLTARSPGERKRCLSSNQSRGPRPQSAKRCLRAVK